MADGMSRLPPEAIKSGQPDKEEGVLELMVMENQSGIDREDGGGEKVVKKKRTRDGNIGWRMSGMCEWYT